MSTNPENKAYKIEKKPSGNWVVYRWSTSQHFKDSWMFEDPFKWRWQARRYVKRMLALPSKTEYHGDL